MTSVASWWVRGTGAPAGRSGGGGGEGGRPGGGVLGGGGGGEPDGGVVVRRRIDPEGDEEDELVHERLVEDALGESVADALADPDLRGSPGDERDLVGVDGRLVADNRHRPDEVASAEAEG